MSKIASKWHEFFIGCAERGITFYNQKIISNSPLFYGGILTSLYNSCLSNLKKVPVDGDPYNFNSCWSRTELLSESTILRDVAVSQSTGTDCGFNNISAQNFLDAAWILLEKINKYSEVTFHDSRLHQISKYYYASGSCGHPYMYPVPECEDVLGYPNYQLSLGRSGYCTDGSGYTINWLTSNTIETQMSCIKTLVETELTNLTWDSMSSGSGSMTSHVEQNMGVSAWFCSGTSVSATGASSAYGYKRAGRVTIPAYNYRTGRVHFYYYTNVDPSTYDEKFQLTTQNALKVLAAYEFDKPQYNIVCDPIYFTLQPPEPDSLSAGPSNWYPTDPNGGPPANCSGSWSSSGSKDKTGVPILFKTWLEIDYKTHQA